MRDEFITHLWEYEKIIPTLFDHRYRVERMRSTKMEKVITATLVRLKEKGVIQSNEESNIAGKILDKLTAGKAGLQLTYLQVYLDRLFQEAEADGVSIPNFSPALVNKVGTFEDIIGEFLSDQISLLETRLGKDKKGVPIRLLSAMITDERTKKVIPVSYTHLTLPTICSV